MPTYNLFIYQLSSFTSGASSWFGGADSIATNPTGDELLTTAATLSGVTAVITDTDLYLQDDPSTPRYQSLVADLTINGTTYARGSTIDVQYLIEGQGSGGAGQVGMAVIRVKGVVVGVAVLNPGVVSYADITANLKPSTSYTFDAISNNDTTRAKQLASNYVEGPDPTSVTCFAAGTMIDTIDGPRPIETLQVGDLVLTSGSGPQAIRWIGRRRLDRHTLCRVPKLRPIRICAGALGAGTPSIDLIVSPQHRILVRSRIAQRMFGTDEVLVAAHLLCGIDGIEIADDLPEITYLHLLFDRHELITSNGAQTESLFTGPQALQGVGPTARDEILALFPELADLDYSPRAARTLACPQRGRKLAARHQKNRQALWADA